VSFRFQFDEEDEVETENILSTWNDKQLSEDLTGFQWSADVITGVIFVRGDERLSDKAL
jgi:hypothetical protein